MDGIRAWGLRLVAAILVLSGAMALASAMTSGQVQLQLRTGRRALHLAGMSAIGVALFIIGCGGVVLLASFPRERQPRAVKFVAMALLIVGGLLAGLQYLLNAVA